MNGQTDPSDPFDLGRFMLTPEMASKLGPKMSKQHEKAGRLVWDKAKGFVPPDQAQKPFRALEATFCMFPISTLEAIVRHTHNAELAILTVCYRTWFENFKRNPLPLSTVRLERLGITRRQKFWSLRKLAESGQITVEMRGGKCPLITLNWLPLET